MVRSTRITRRHNRSHKRSTTLHRRRYGKGRKGRKCRKTRRGLRGGDLDIVLAGDVGLEDSKHKGMTALKKTFAENKETYYVRLKTDDEYESNKYELDTTLMKYIETNYSDAEAVPKITTVTLCDDDKGVKKFVAQQFIEEYRSKGKEKASGATSSRFFNFFRPK